AGLYTFIKAIPGNIEVENIHQSFGTRDLDHLPGSAQFVSPIQGSNGVEESLGPGNIVSKPNACAGGIAALAAREKVLGQAGIVDPGICGARERLEHPLAELGLLVLPGAPLAEHADPHVDHPG